jgi:hypothetical protein
VADEGGVSFWAPGFLGSLAAAPQQPGWSLATIYYHTSVSAGSDVALAREFETGRVPASLSARLSASLNATGDVGFVIPTYVFATPVLGGQASASLLGAYGVTSASLAGTLSGNPTTPGGSIPIMRSVSFSDTSWGFGDLMPEFSLRWNAGVNNYMTYITGDIPVGAYQSTRLANLGIGHGAIDAGGSYTYFNPETGRWDWWGTRTKKLAATAARAIALDASSRRCSASGRSSATSFRSARAFKVTSISKATRNSAETIPKDGPVTGSHPSLGTQRFETRVASGSITVPNKVVGPAAAIHTQTQIEGSAHNTQLSRRPPPCTASSL